MGTFAISDHVDETAQVELPATASFSRSVQSRAASVSFSSVSTSPKPGMRNTFSAEYPENEVVSPKGMTESPEEAVFKEGVEDDDLIRKSDDVEESTRNDVFWRVVQENVSRRTEPTAVAEEKYPHVLETLYS